MRLLKDKIIIDALRCPICKQKIKISDSGTMLCLGEKTHCYDFSSSGYVNLLPPSQSGGGDSKEAVRARSSFLETGAYLPVSDAICKLLGEFCSKQGLIVDAGCGEGYYSCNFAKNGFSVYGADISKAAVDAASKRAKRCNLDNVFFSTASVFELPIENSSADAVTNIFAPCAEKEYSRILKKEGILIVAWAGEQHLMGLKNAIYDTTNINTERADLPKCLNKIAEARVVYDMELNSNEQILNLFSMTPYYWRTSTKDKDKLLHLQKLITPIDIIISVYKIP